VTKLFSSYLFKFLIIKRIEKSNNIVRVFIGHDRITRKRQLLSGNLLCNGQGKMIPLGIAALAVRGYRIVYLRLYAMLK
jgi:hypothetical protein